MILNNIRHPHLADAYQLMAEQSTLPLWEIYGSLVAPRPEPQGVAHLWRYADLRPLLLNAGTQISAAEAERRVLALKNPGLDHPAVAQTLFAGLQLVMPGESAPSHRHTQSAIRFVLESSGGYTSVEGERCEMRRGDFVLTPNSCWHDHHNTGDKPLIWLDGLDIPIVSVFASKFAQGARGGERQFEPAAADKVDPWFSAMRPSPSTPKKLHSPIYNYHYERSRAALMQYRETHDADPRFGWKLSYANPRDDGPVLPTLSAFLQSIPAGMTTTAWRSTESTVFAVVEGEGTARVGASDLRFHENDVFVIPNWSEFAIEAKPDCILFSFSDRAAQQRLGIWFEQPPYSD